MEGFGPSPFLSGFVQEARERIDRLNQGLLALEANPEDREAFQEVVREAHTLKGAARMVGLPSIGALAHKMEDILAMVERGRTSLQGSLFDRLFEALDLLSQRVERIARGEGEAPDLEEACRRLEAALEEQGVPEVAPQREEVRPVYQLLPERREGTIRIALEKLDRLSNLVVESAVERMQAAEGRRGLQGLLLLAKQAGRRWSELREKLLREGTAEAVRTYEDLERRLQEGLARLFEELEEAAVREDLLSEELRHEVMAIRMQPLNTVFQAFPRAVRDLARGFGKEVELVIKGGETELDTRIIEGLGEPLLHLLRNAIDHGLEPPGEREALGKGRRGKVAITASQRGGRVFIEVEDDGRGIDLRTVREAAVRRRLLSPEEAFSLSDAEALELIFLPGFSTSRLITDVSGRGVGMDVVRAALRRLKGSVSVETSLGEGTKVVLDLPLTLAMLRALLLQAGGQVFALSASSVEQVVQVEASDIRRVEGREAFRFEGQTVPLVHLGALLGLVGEVGETFPVVVVASSGRRIGFAVDHVLDEAEIVVKDLGSYLGKVANVSGATILGSGEVALILDASELCEAAKGLPELRPSLLKEKALKEAPPSILLVEDSLIARDLERNILEAAGYQVEVAVDGIDALEQLEAGEFQLVVTDIEMPRMDGFELVARIRAKERWKDLPVVVVTAKESAEDRRRGIEVGADAYILKSAFDQGSLLEIIGRFIGRP